MKNSCIISRPLLSYDEGEGKKKKKERLFDPRFKIMTRDN